MDFPPGLVPGERRQSVTGDWGAPRHRRSAGRTLALEGVLGAPPSVSPAKPLARGSTSLVFSLPLEWEGVGWDTRRLVKAQVFCHCFYKCFPLLPLT